jgi:hypothetical protein
MPAPRKLTCVQRRLEKRIQSLEPVRLDGNAAIISELKVELDYLSRARRYLEE